MSRLAIGTAQFGLPYGISNQNGQVSESKAREILKLAETSEVDLIDTAIGYGNSEQRLGIIGTKNFRVVTKLGAPSTNCKDVSSWFKDAVNDSLSRLKLQRIYGLLFHSTAPLLGTDGPLLYKELQNLKHLGIVQKIGISIYAPAELDALFTHMSFDIVQAPLNIFDRRLVTSGWLAKLKEMDIEVHTRSSFLQGLLLLGESELPLGLYEHKSIFKMWQKFLKNENVNAINACLGYPFSMAEVDRVVVGVDSPSQLSQLIKSELEHGSLKIPDFFSNDENLIDPRLWRLS